MWLHAVFNYNTMFHNVLQVTKQDYESCNVKSPVATFASGRDFITLDKAGHSYFVCGFPGHCQAGLKVAISVRASSSQSPDVPSPPSTPREIPPPPPPQTLSAPGQPNFHPPPLGSPNVPLPPGFPNFGTPSGPGFPYLPPFESGASLHSSNLKAAMLSVIMTNLFAVFAYWLGCRCLFLRVFILSSFGEEPLLFFVSITSFIYIYI